ncbi:hypothetical protein WJX84_000138 [Apatococcus fuscideae]|uniref:Histidine phosphatase family protein n=1 Tax=Apatococcus fuscideae TaxID=2026836 RepID=A0AAW1T5A4_9CHLO
MPSTRVLLARHGERVDLVDNEWTRTAERPHDAPLTETGLHQARKLGERLKHEGIDRIYASPFLRTVQTAAQVASVIQMPICIENGLCEPLLNRLFPETFAGFNHPELLAKDMPCIDRSYQPLRKPQHPESYSSAQRRCGEVVRALAERHPGQSILLVTHGLCLEYMATALVTSEGMSFSMPYCCLTECIRGGQGSSSHWQYGCKLDASFL